MLAIFRTPDVVSGRVFRHIVAAAEDVNLAVQHSRLMIGPRRPAGARRVLPPYFAVGRGPDVVLEAVLVAEVIILGAPQKPHAALEFDHGGGQPRRPSG